MAQKSLLTRLFGSTRRAFVALVVGYVASIVAVATFGGPFALDRAGPMFMMGGAMLAVIGVAEFYGGSDD